MAKNKSELQPLKQANQRNLSLLIYSQIQVVKENGFQTLDLWAKDLNAQVDEGITIYLLSEVFNEAVSGWQGIAPLDSRIKVIELVKGKSIKDLLADTSPDIFQIPGNMPWEHSAISRQIVRFAKGKNKPVIVGISSNRAKTQIMNAVNDGFLKKCKAYIKAFSIRLSQFYLTTVCEGTFIVGDGLKQLVSPFCKNLYIGIASWISENQIQIAQTPDAIPPLKMVVAARLEPMKGVHLAIEAIRILIDTGYADASLDILGEGSEHAYLNHLVTTYSLNEHIKFLGTFPYPTPFLDILSKYSFVVVTNLNDEQPRIVFDALSRMIIPVCPDLVQFRALNLPTELIYQNGNATDLAEKLANLAKQKNHDSILKSLSMLIQEHTLESMHRKRKEWLLTLAPTP